MLEEVHVLRRNQLCFELRLCHHAMGLGRSRDKGTAGCTRGRCLRCDKSC